MKYKKIYIEIINICNLKCSFCKPCKRIKKFITVSKFEKIIKLILPYTKYIYLHILGEPLLHKNLDKILDVCHKNNMQVNITTNGTLISKVGNMLLEKKAIRQINFSIHSFIDNKIYNDYLENIIRFTDIAKKNIFIVYRFWNLQDSKNSYDELNKEIINYILKYFNYNKKISNKIISGNGICIHKNVYLQQNKQFIWPDINGEKIFLKGRCYGLKDHIGILVDGTVVPCCMDGDGYNSIGNIFESSLENIINSKKAMEIKEGFSNFKVINEYCQTCGFINSKNLNNNS